MLATLVAAFLSTAAPEPLDPDLACIVDRVPAAARAVILTETASEADGPAQAALIDAATACQAERDWTAEYAANAVMIATALILGEEASKHLDSAGISVELIDTWFDRQPREIQTMGHMDDVVGEQVVRHLVGEGVALAHVEANAMQIGIYVGARMILARSADGLGPPS